MNSTHELTIRNFENGDEAPLSALIIDNLLLVNGRDYGQEAVSEMARLYTPEHVLEIAGRGTMFVALENGTPVGTASYDQGRIRNVFVRIDLHGHGVGRRLMERIEAIARQQGEQRLCLRASLTAVAFYQKLGYVRVEEIDKWIGAALFRVIEMQKPLFPGD